MVVFAEHAAESVASSYAKADDLVRSRERYGQWLERAGVHEVGLVPDQRAVQ
jgi:hypothetical protein